MPPRKRPAESPSADNATLEGAVTDLTGEVRTLVRHVEVLRIAVDDLRQELEFAIRNFPREPRQPTQPLVSMPRDALAQDFTINRMCRENMPKDDRTAAPPPVTPSTVPRMTDKRIEELF